jgi:hypothetical protein
MYQPAWAHPKEGCRAATPPPPQKSPNVKDKCYIDTMLSNLRRDLPFSRHQQLKSANDLVHYNFEKYNKINLCSGIAQSAQRLATGWTVWGTDPGTGETFRAPPDRPWGSHSFLYSGYRVS